MGLTEIQKQTIAQRDGISIRAIAAEVVLINVQFYWPNKKSNLCIRNFIKKAMFTQLIF
jgi:hypothetical protein